MTRNQKNIFLYRFDRHALPYHVSVRYDIIPYWLMTGIDSGTGSAILALTFLRELNYNQIMTLSLNKVN